MIGIDISSMDKLFITLSMIAKNLMRGDRMYHNFMMGNLKLVIHRDQKENKIHYLIVNNDGKYIDGDIIEETGNEKELIEFLANGYIKCCQIIIKEEKHGKKENA